MLDQVVTLEQGSGPAQINRINRARSISLDVELSGMELGKTDRNGIDAPLYPEFTAGHTSTHSG